jgi:hypothetical protein
MSVLKVLTDIITREAYPRTTLMNLQNINIFRLIYTVKNRSSHIFCHRNFTIYRIMGAMKVKTYIITGIVEFDRMSYDSCDNVRQDLQN